MARGDLSSVQISYEAGDELGSLADDMRSMTAILLNVIQDETYLLGEMADGNFDVRSKTEASYVGDFQRLLAVYESNQQPSEQYAAADEPGGK